jgi:hypothetical protein
MQLDGGTASTTPQCNGVWQAPLRDENGLNTAEDGDLSAAPLVMAAGSDFNF